MLAANGLEAFRMAQRAKVMRDWWRKIFPPRMWKARSTQWLKVKIHQEDEFVIAGYTKPAGSRQYFGALLLGAYEQGKLHFVGKVGNGIRSETLAALHRKFQPFVRSQPALPGLRRARRAWFFSRRD